MAHQGRHLHAVASVFVVRLMSKVPATEKAANLSIAAIMSPIVIPLFVFCGLALIVWLVFYAYYHVILELWRE